MKTTSMLPPIYIGKRDLPVIAACAAELRRANDLALVGFLASEISRARLCVGNEFPSNAVAINARISVRDDVDRAVEWRILVAPWRYTPTGQFLSLASPLGIAVLGLQVGSRMPYKDRNGRTRHAVVEDISHSSYNLREIWRAPKATPQSIGVAKRREADNNIVPLQPRSVPVLALAARDDPEPPSVA